jgi:hypothetical protein
VVQFDLNQAGATPWLERRKTDCVKPRHPLPQRRGEAPHSRRPPAGMHSSLALKPSRATNNAPTAAAARRPPAAPQSAVQAAAAGRARWQVAHSPQSRSAAAPIAPRTPRTRERDAKMISPGRRRGQSMTTGKSSNSTLRCRPYSHETWETAPCCGGPTGRSMMRWRRRQRGPPPRVPREERLSCITY